MSGLGLPGRVRAGSDASVTSQHSDASGVELSSIGSMTTPGGRGLTVTASMTTPGVRGSDRLSMQAVKARISVYGTDKNVPIIFEVSLYRKGTDDNNKTLPGIEKLIADIENVFKRMTDAEIDNMDAFNINFSRTRSDGSEEMPKYDFKSFSTRAVGSAEFKDYKVSDNKKLGEEIGALGVKLKAVHDEHIEKQNAEKPADGSTPSAKKPKKKRAAPTQQSSAPERTASERADRKEPLEHKRGQGASASQHPPRGVAPLD